MMELRRVCVGIITKPFGIKGQVKLHPHTTSPDFFVQHTRLFLKDSTKIVLRCPRVEQSGDVVAWVEGIADRASADCLRMEEVFVAREELPQLGNDEYYHEDLIGLNVVGDKHQQVGQISSVQDYGAGAFLEINLTGRKTATIPFNREAIIAVNFQACEIVINTRFLLL